MSHSKNLFGSGNQEYLQLKAEFVHTLSGDDFLGAVLPVHRIPLFQEIIEKVENEENCPQQLEIMCKYNCHIFDLFWITSDIGKTKELMDFLNY